MAGNTDTPMDEVQWRSAVIAQEMGGVHNNTVLHYFARSPFFDTTSNNATLANQAMYNPNLHVFIQTREAFETRLQTISGLEYVVSHDPSNNGQQHENSGVWVIRKQNRRKRHGQEDEVTPLASYFVVGEYVYMCPSLANILEGRLLSIVTCLTKVMSTATPLPIFTPSRGYVYAAAATKPAGSAGNIRVSQTSSENTPMPDISAPSKKLPDQPAEDGAKLDMRTLAESLHLSNAYRTQYMDDNPLVGEPGSFIMHKSKDAPVPLPASKVALKTYAPTTAVSTPIPPPLKTDIPPISARKGSKIGDKTPTTPGGKKRKKSRVATMTTSPK